MESRDEIRASHNQFALCVLTFIYELLKKMDFGLFDCEGYDN